MDLPLGFVLKGKVTGLDIIYELTDEAYNYLNAKHENQSVISSIGSLVSGDNKSNKDRKIKRVTNINKVDIDKNMKLIDFKNLRVNRFQTFSFIIKNESGIHTNFNLKVNRFAPGMERSLKTDMMKKLNENGSIILTFIN